MFGQSLLSAFGIACTTDTDQLFNPTSTQINSTATYQLNNATTSIPSNTYPGTASNITYAAGKFGNAAVFNGSSSYILASAFMPTGSAARSVSAWVKTTVSNTNMTILMYGSGGTNNYFIFRILNGKLGIAFYANDHDFTATGLTDGNWHHAVATYDGSSAKVYLDGSLIGTGSAGAVSTNSNNVAIGGYSNGVDALFNGSIDQVRIFNTALSQAAVTALYNETTTTAQNAYITEEVYNGIAYYKMSDATDQLGNYNGTATNVNFNTEGKFGFAGAFNGSSSKIEASSLSISGNTSFSFSLWVKPNDVSTEQWIIQYGASAGDATLYLQLDSNGFSGNNYTTGQYFPLSITANNWYHCVIGYDSSASEIFIQVNNGTRVTKSATVNISSSNLLMGHRSGASSYFNGSIDQVRIYDSALSAADVSKLYKEIECEPVAINALDHFNTVLYTGSGSTQSINTVGFQPDFTWIKDRSIVVDHALFDSVRGATEVIRSNQTTAETTRSDSLTSFDSNGFTLGSDGVWWVNKSADNYVSWNWKAPLANLSTSFNGSNSSIVLGSAVIPSNNFSISMWVNSNDVSTQNNLITQYVLAGGSNGRFVFVIDGGYFQAYVESNGSGTNFNYVLSNNTWYHVTLVKSGSWECFVNGTSVGTWSDTVNITTSYNTQLGSRVSSTNALNGKLEQVRIFNTVLSASEISDLYAEPAASNNTLNYPAGAGCIAAYPLQTDAVDLSGNYNGASSNVTFGQPGYLTQNTEGTITSTVAANVDAGFSVVKYTGNGTSGSTIGHGLSDTPQMMISKRTDSGDNWNVYTEATGNTGILYLNLTDAFTTVSNRFNNTSPTSTVFTVGNSPAINVSGGEYIAYCFHSVDGYSKIGSYIGTGATGNVQYVGFEPSFVMVKATSTSEPWFILDNKRDPNNPRDNRLMPDSSAAESTGSVHTMNFNSNNFTLNGTVGNGTNGNGQTYIYLAIA